MFGVSAQLTTIDAPTAFVCGDHCHWPAVSKVVHCSSCRVLSIGLIQLIRRRPSGDSAMSGCADAAHAGSGHPTRVLPAASVVSPAKRRIGTGGGSKDSHRWAPTKQNK